MPTIEEHYSVLGLSPGAGLTEVTTAFRRLAKEHHPDVAGPGGDPRHFLNILRAYTALRDTLQAQGGKQGEFVCPRCHRRVPVLHDPAGRSACAQCLLGETRRSRFLPLPAMVIARHLAVFAAYASALVCLVCYLREGRYCYAAASFACVTAGLLLLAIEVLRIVRPRSLNPAQH